VRLVLVLAALTATTGDRSVIHTGSRWFFRTDPVWITA